MPQKLKCAECQNPSESNFCCECEETRNEMLEETRSISASESGEKSTKQAVGKGKDTKENQLADANQEMKAEGISTMSEEKQHQQKLRKSTRSTRFKSKPANSSHPNVANINASNANVNTAANNKTQSKRNRRSLTKKVPTKLNLAHSQATIRYAESLFYKGQYMQVGDIVSLVDEDSTVYYAQIRGLLIDSYCEKSAYLTWLIPTRESPNPNEKFDPATYLIGPDEDLSRKLSFLRFVMHAPSNYYFDRTQPFPMPDTLDKNPGKGAYTWVSI